MRLKINQPDYDRLKALVILVCNTPPYQGIQEVQLRYRNAGLSDARCYWDIFHAACKHDKDLLNHLYDYLNDNHIAAALRHIMKNT